MLIGKVDRLLLPALMDGTSAHHAGRVGNGAPAEAVGKDLVGEPLSKPPGDRLRVVIDGELILAQLRTASVQSLQAQGIPDQPHVFPCLQRAGEDIPGALDPMPEQDALHHGIVPALKPGGEDHAGVSPRPGRADGKAYLGPRRDRAVGKLTLRVPGVEDKGVRHGHSFQSSKVELRSADEHALAIDGLGGSRLSEVDREHIGGHCCQSAARVTVLGHQGDGDLRVIIRGESTQRRRWPRWSPSLPGRYRSWHPPLRAGL